MPLGLFPNFRRPLQPKKTCDILLAPENDHLAISIHIQSDISAQKEGPGFWKFNTALLEVEFYIAALRENIPTFKANTPI